MIPNQLLAVFVAVGPVDTPDRCNAWIDSADRRCNKPCEDYLCARHVTVARRRGEKAVQVERERDQALKARYRDRYDLDALTAERDRIQARIDQVTGIRRHDTDDMAAYGGIGIRQTERQRRQYASRMHRALDQYSKLTKQLEAVEAQISRAKWAAS